MYKKNLWGKICCIVILTFFLCSAAQAITVEKNTTLLPKDTEWVLMVYLCGDNNLSAGQAQQLELIRQVGASDQVKIAILIDQNAVGDTRLYYLNGTTLVQQTWPSESSTDDPTTIVSFFNQVKNDIPANHYALFMSSNKGSGWQGVCWDDHGRGQMITMPELLDGLNQITNNGAEKFDVLSIETCMTGNLEVAYQANSCVDYFIAYPECSMLLDYPYAPGFTALLADPAMTPEQFVITFVNFFVPHDYPQYRMRTTLAGTNLSYAPSLAASLDDLGVFFIEHLDDYKSQITTALESARIYARLWYIDYYIDFYDFLDLCTINDPEFTLIRDTIRNTMDAAVLANKHLADDPAHGLSIYFPRRAGDYNDALRYPVLPSMYEETRFAIDTHWDEFLKLYLGLVNNTAPEKPTIDGPTRVKIGVPQDYTVSTSDAEDQQVYYFIDWGDDNTSGWIGPYDSDAEITLNHSWVVKGTYIVQVKAKDTVGAQSEWASLSVKVPYIAGTSRIFLIGKITSLEKTQPIGFRFLPVKVLEINRIVGQNHTRRILDETNGEYPCCGYLAFSEFKGIVTQHFIAGIWKIAS